MRPWPLLFCLPLSALHCGETKTEPPLVFGKLSANPSPLMLPAGPVGGRVLASLSIRNDASGAARVSATTITMGAPDFTVSSDPFSIAPFSSQNITVALTVPAEGPVTGELTITHDGSNGPTLVVPLSGEGLSQTECFPCNARPPPTCLANGSSAEYVLGPACEGTLCTFQQVETPCPSGCSAESGRCTIPSNTCGSPLAPAPIGLTTMPPDGVALAWSGEGYGAVWSEPSAEGPRVLFQRLNGRGERLLDPIDLAPGKNGGPEVGIAGGQAGFGVVLPVIGTDEEGLAFALIGKDGTVLAQPTPIGTDVRYLRAPSIAYNPTQKEFGVAYAAAPRTPGLPTQIRFVRFSAEGQRLGQFTTVSDPLTNAAHPQLAFAGDKYGVAYERDVSPPATGGVLWVPLDATGFKLGPEVEVAPGPGGVPYLMSSQALAGKGDGFGLLYSNQSTGFINLYFVELTAAGQVTRGPLTVTDVSGTTWQQVLVPSMTGFWAGWIDVTNFNQPQRMVAPISDVVGPALSQGVGAELSLAPNGCDLGIATIGAEGVQLRAAP
ncbi:MAG: hypothetical protein IPG45_12585 [Deltaproteobacteria bacterium]|nr:hypothetical protein [Deltaproteobacteria bacterium]